jgi:hypothetical protein
MRLAAAQRRELEGLSLSRKHGARSEEARAVRTGGDCLPRRERVARGLSLVDHREAGRSVSRDGSAAIEGEASVRRRRGRLRILRTSPRKGAAFQKCPRRREHRLSPIRRHRRYRATHESMSRMSELVLPLNPVPPVVRALHRLLSLGTGAALGKYRVVATSVRSRDTKSLLGRAAARRRSCNRRSFLSCSPCAARYGSANDQSVLTSGGIHSFRNAESV